MNKNKDFVFKPRARLLLQLGDQLIKNESIAVLELVKNSYDADASFCFIEMMDIDDPKKGKIIIEDDGFGMDLDIIRNVWLEPGSDYKKKQFDKRIRTPKFRRLPIGEKGIGRFGVHKLGEKIKMITRSEGNEEIVVEIDWREFAQENKYLDKIPIDISEREPEVFKNNQTGTKIIISRLRQDWERGRVRKLYKSIFALSSPFKENDSFNPELRLNNHQEWLEGLIGFDEIEKYALYYFEATIKDHEVTDFTYKFMPWENMDEVDGRIIDTSDDFYEDSKVLQHQIKYKDDKGKIKKELATIELGRYNIGEIEFKGYIFDRDSTILNMMIDGSKRQFKNYLNENGGIRVYRDNIRINEYGEKGNDWLNLDIGRVNIPGKKISNNQILGIINLDRDKSIDLEEKTNREGFVENDAYNLFRDAILYVLNDMVLSLRNLDKTLLREKYNQGSVSEPVTDGIQDLKKEVNINIKEDKTKEKLLTLIDQIESEYKEVQEILLTSAGSGLSLSMVFHEIEKIINELNHIVKADKVPDRIVSLAERLSELIVNYGNIIRQSKQDNHSLKTLVNGAIFNMEYRVEDHDIHIINDIEKFEGDDIIECSKRHVLSAVMNIVDNSIYWLEKKRGQLELVEEFQKKIYLKIIDDEAAIGLLIADNGKGFTINKDRMVKPFVSEKKDGMGLGLHLANEVMKLMDGSLEFPEYGDYSMPENFKKGAKILLKFKKG